MAKVMPCDFGKTRWQNLCRVNLENPMAKAMLCEFQNPMAKSMPCKFQTRWQKSMPCEFGKPNPKKTMAKVYAALA
jgi:hypothetical protein